MKYTPAMLWLALALATAPASAPEIPPGASPLRLAIRLESKYMAPEGYRQADGSLGALTAWVKGRELVGSERARVLLRVDGVTVTVEFEVRSVEHPERLLAFAHVTHEYQMRLLRFQHGYKRDPKDGSYAWDSDSEDPHEAPKPIPQAQGRELDAFLQRGVELWVDRALSLILLNLEQEFRKYLDKQP